MKTKEIMEKINKLQDEIGALKEKLPFSATIWNDFEGGLPSGLFLVSNNWDSDYTNYIVASDDLEVIKEFCLSLNQEFQIRTDGVETHSSIWDNEKRKYVIGTTDNV